MSDPTLEELQSQMRNNGVVRLLVKELAANDNAKNQLYLAGSMEVANILPFGTVRSETTTSGNKSLKAPVLFYWLQRDGKVIPAPGAQLILYPQYPEVRLSGFLRGAQGAPSQLLNTRAEGRLLFFGITGERRIIAWATDSRSKLGRQYQRLHGLEREGVFYILPLASADEGKTTRDQLLAELGRVHELDWIAAKALNSDGTLRECNSSHCVGYTLEAELGVPRNGKAEPDYKGWEIKAGVVRNFAAPYTGKAVTLMTPEPTGGYYKNNGVAEFIIKFGYADKRGRADRLNFGGKFLADKRNAGTELTLKLNGFDAVKRRVNDPDGSLMLVTDDNFIAAEWSFAALLTLWNRKHAQAAYVPAECCKEPNLSYRYGSKVRLGVGTSFERLLSAVAGGDVYYDPGIKLERASESKPTTKRRSQFRVASKALSVLYERMDEVIVV